SHRSSGIFWRFKPVDVSVGFRNKSVYACCYIYRALNMHRPSLVASHNRQAQPPLTLTPWSGNAGMAMSRIGLHALLGVTTRASASSSYSYTRVLFSSILLPRYSTILDQRREFQARISSIPVLGVQIVCSQRALTRAPLLF